MNTTSLHIIDNLKSDIRLPTVIFDIDSTLSDHSKFTDYFHSPDICKISEDYDFYEPVRQLYLMYKYMSYNIIIVTARDEDWIESTLTWLKKHNIIFNSIYFKRDRWSASLYKQEAVNHLREIGHEIHCAFDDDPEVINMYRSMGIYTFDCNQN